MSEQKEAPAPMTDAEIKARKEELTKFYKDQLPLLKLQKEYEQILTAIDVAKMTRLEIMIAKAQIMAPAPGEESKPISKSEE